MKLVKVNPTPVFLVTCIKCGKNYHSDTAVTYADLEGKPFKDYYCVNCLTVFPHVKEVSHFILIYGFSVVLTGIILQQVNNLALTMIPKYQ
jgi:hypothetical protein